jgi:3-methylcrotonyl-CoA carboxylase alpha subunit
MIKSVLIANRGEIACRIIHTAKKLNIRTIVAYSDADATSLAVEMGDESYNIGPPSPLESYLNINKVIEAAKNTQAEAIHPGYGFLSENPAFAQACQESHILFIGPSLDALKKMGSKKEAKAIAHRLGIPTIPGFEGDQTQLFDEAQRIGFPLMIKPVMGGGGKGMRRVDRLEDFLQTLGACQREALSAFGDEEVLLEKVIPSPRHVEVQIFGDTHGNIVHLFERDCTLQRRYQKVMEEAPSLLDPDIKDKLFKAALKMGQAVKYVGAGTVEFLVDPKTNYYFLEMNTRLQVEHPVTEEITGLDLVEWQFRIASGEELPLSQNEIRATGHALELRLYAEDPSHHFIPSVGPLWVINTPQGNRIDKGYKEKDTISPYYDPLIAKFIVKGKNRKEVLEKTKESLAKFEILGIKTNINYLYKIISNNNIINNNYDITYIDKHLSQMAGQGQVPEDVYVMASLIKILTQRESHESPWDENDKWTLTGYSPQSFEWATENGPKQITLTYSSQGWVHSSAKPLTVKVHENILFYGDKKIPFWKISGKISFIFEGETYNLELVQEKNEQLQSEHQLKAPLTGKVSLIEVQEGDHIKKGQPLIILEAMKMEHLISAPQSGIIKQINYRVGDVVHEGSQLIEIEDVEKCYPNQSK